MKMKRFDVTISTTKLQQSKEFYMKHFGFELVYESKWYVELITSTLPAIGISFVLPQREAGEFFNRKGIILSFEVDNVDSEYQRLKEAGLTIVQGLEDKPWGERSFVVDDPNGAHLYIYKSIAPTPEYQVVYDSFKK